MLQRHAIDSFTRWILAGLCVQASKLSIAAGTLWMFGTQKGDEKPVEVARERERERVSSVRRQRCRRRRNSRNNMKQKKTHLDTWKAFFATCFDSIGAFQTVLCTTNHRRCIVATVVGWVQWTHRGTRRIRRFALHSVTIFLCGQAPVRTFGAGALQGRNKRQ